MHLGICHILYVRHFAASQCHVKIKALDYSVPHFNMIPDDMLHSYMKPLDEVSNWCFEVALRLVGALHLDIWLAEGSS